MTSRFLSIISAAALSAALVVAQERPGQPPAGQPDRGGQPGAAVSLDGTWTVVSCSRDGKAVDGADKMTVTIKGNVATFADAAGKPDKQMRAVRLDFGPNGTLRVAEANADGKFDPPGGDRPGGAGTPPPAGKDQPPATGTQPGGAGQPGRPGGLGDRGTMTGVYVLTPDFLAVSVFAPMGGGDRPGGDRPGGTGNPPPGGTGTNPGGTTQPGGAGQPGGTGAGQPGGVGAAGGPQMKSHLSVILKKGGPGRE